MQYLGLGLVENLLRAAAERVVRGVGDVARGGRELAQDRPVADDLGVVADVRGGRDIADQRPQVRKARRHSRASARRRAIPTPSRRRPACRLRRAPRCAGRSAGAPRCRNRRRKRRLRRGRRRRCRAAGRPTPIAPPPANAEAASAHRVGDRRAWRAGRSGGSILPPSATQKGPSPAPSAKYAAPERQVPVTVSPMTRTVMLATASECSATTSGWSPTCFSGPAGIRTAPFSTAMPLRLQRLDDVALVTEPNSRPSTPAFCVTSIVRPSSLPPVPARRRASRRRGFELRRASLRAA